MRYQITCDNCGMDIRIKNFGIVETKLKGNPVKVQSFSCPKCDEVYVVAVFDKESDRMRNELKSLQSDFKELANMPQGAMKDERARVLINEQKAKKRMMIAHNNRLKKAYIKELRRHGKRQ